MDDRWDNLISLEKDQFKRICRRLLSQTFIVRDKDNDSKKMFAFICKKRDILCEYFNYMGFDVYIDRDSGVAMLQNKSEQSVNRLSLKKLESIVLCALWTIYANRISEGSLVRNINIEMINLSQELERYKLKEKPDKTQMTQALSLFRRFNLIDIFGEIGDHNCIIRLYPSLQFALDRDGFAKFAEDANKRMIETKETAEDDNDEEYCDCEARDDV